MGKLFLYLNPTSDFSTSLGFGLKYRATLNNTDEKPKYQEGISPNSPGDLYQLGGGGTLGSQVLQVTLNLKICFLIY